MKSLAMITVLLLTSGGAAQSAHRYFEKLYKTGGLDQMADEYVCFDHNPSVEDFFTFTKSMERRDLSIAEGEFAKLPEAKRDKLNKGFLIMRRYDKGLLEPYEDIFSPDGSSWVEKGVIHKAPMKIRFTINSETMRYKRFIETKLRSAPAGYGHCENVQTKLGKKDAQ
jgi:hypothetical protein